MEDGGGSIACLPACVGRRGEDVGGKGEFEEFFFLPFLEKGSLEGEGEGGVRPLENLSLKWSFFVFLPGCGELVGRGRGYDESHLKGGGRVVGGMDVVVQCTIPLYVD